MKKSKTTKILLTGLFFLFFFFIGSSMVLAEDKPTELYLQTMIPGSEQRDLIKFDGTTRELGKYISSIYTYAISIVGIVATIMLMFGGFVWLTAGGSGDKVGKARDIIFGSLTGLVLTLTSYTLLNMINPDLVNFKVINIRQVDDKGGGLSPCLVNDSGGYYCRNGQCDLKTLTCLEPTVYLSTGQVCVNGKMPYCDYGLECIEGVCKKNESHETYSQSGQYQWRDVDDCSTIGKTNYGDTFCPDPKPTGQICCGLFL